jgi:hypothetical protein
MNEETRRERNPGKEQNKYSLLIDHLNQNLSE